MASNESNLTEQSTDNLASVNVASLNRTTDEEIGAVRSAGSSKLSPINSTRIHDDRKRSEPFIKKAG